MSKQLDVYELIAKNEFPQETPTKRKPKLLLFLAFLCSFFIIALFEFVYKAASRLQNFAFNSTRHFLCDVSDV